MTRVKDSHAQLSLRHTDDRDGRVHNAVSRDGNTILDERKEKRKR